MSRAGEELTERSRKWKVREAVIKDLNILTEFSLLISEETEGKKLNPSIVKIGIEKVLLDSTVGQIFVAYNKDKVIGCFMINGREWSEWRNGFILWLTGTYTTVDYRRKGVRKALFDHACQWAKSESQVVGLRGYRHRSNNTIHSAAITGGMKETEYRINEIIF